MIVAAILLVSRLSQLVAAADSADDYLPSASSTTCIDNVGCESCLTQIGWGCHWCPVSKICLGALASCPRDDEASLFSERQCRCGDVSGGTCASCVHRPGCIYARDGTITYRVLGESFSQRFHSNRTGPGGLCLEGSAFANGHKYYVISDAIGMYVDVDPETWCWGQCYVTGAWFVSLIIAAAFLLFSLLLWAVMPRRRRSGSEYHALR